MRNIMNKNLNEKQKQGMAEGQLNELFDMQQEYFKLADGTPIRVEFNQAGLSADAMPGSIKITTVDPKIMPMSGMQAIQPWDKARQNIRMAIQKWVQSGQKGVAEDKDPCWKDYKQLGTKKKAGKTVPNCVPKEGMAEEFNPEYDDEAGMAQGSLHTLQNAVEGLQKVIDSGDNLPEWCQEKISLAEDYLVTVWDYIQSEKAQGVEPELNEHKKGVRAMKYTVKPRNFVAKNATTSGAGEHKDKKKETKKGNLKHKKKPEHSLAESNWYEIRLNTLLENSLKKK